MSDERDETGSPTVDPAAVAAGTREIHEAIGRFVVEFSTIMSALAETIVLAIGGNPQATRALLAEITARPLLQAWRSVIALTCEPAEADQQIIRAVALEIEDLIEKRNDLAHGVWLVGYGNEQTVDWSEAYLERLKNRAQGTVLISPFSNPPTAATIDAEATRAQVIARAVRLVEVLVCQPHGIETQLPERVRIEGGGQTRRISISVNGVDWETSRPVSAGWDVQTEVGWADVVARRDGRRLSPRPRE